MLSKEQLDMSDEKYYFSPPDPYIDEIEFAIISRVHHMQNIPGYENQKNVEKIILEQVKNVIEEYFAKRNHLEHSKK